MALKASWSQEEIAATVADYMQMLQLELADQRYNKTQHRRALMAKLNGRSDAAVEMKHQNISEALRTLGRAWIVGYKPLSNLQGALKEEVVQWLQANPQLDRFLEAAIDKPAVMPSHFSFDGFLVAPPVVGREVREPTLPYQTELPQLHRDYIAREAANQSLGLAGELLVLAFERQRLISCGCDRLADRVEHVAKTRGDGLGYDILSFETTGRERLIEVKTTSFAKEMPFYASRNEVACSADHADLFVLMRVYDFRRAAHAFELPGSIARNCHLDAITYSCQLR